MILLAFAVLFGSAHAASWSHNHANGDDHAPAIAHVDDHLDDHDGDFGQTVEQEEPSDAADVTGDVVGHHSHPVGTAVAAGVYGLGVSMSSTVTAITPTRMLASFSQAPPTQPPSA